MKLPSDKYNVECGLRGTKRSCFLLSESFFSTHAILLPIFLRSSAVVTIRIANPRSTMRMIGPSNLPNLSKFVTAHSPIEPVMGPVTSITPDDIFVTRHENSRRAPLASRQLFNSYRPCIPTMLRSSSRRSTNMTSSSFCRVESVGMCISNALASGRLSCDAKVLCTHHSKAKPNLFPNRHLTRQTRSMSSVPIVSANDSGILVGLSTSIPTPPLERLTTKHSILVPLSRVIFPAFDTGTRGCNR